jgi:uncharacterized heparinase superfamily protein
MSESADWGRLFRTVRYLTPRQIGSRAWLTARYRLYALWPGAATLGLDGPAQLRESGLEALRRAVRLKYPGAPSARQHELAAGAAARRFRFLGRDSEPVGDRVDWRAKTQSRLWQYQLHYADYVPALALEALGGGDPRAADHALDLMAEWIAANPPPAFPGWEPYPLSLRTVQWIHALALLEPRIESAARSAIGGSLAAQGRFLERHLESHLGGNHLIKNAKALLVLGVALDCPEAPGWRARGARIFMEEMRRQILRDGGHVERSPSYHGIVLEDLLDVLAISAEAGIDPSRAAELQEIGRRMTTWFAAMRHPDGGLALFNDGEIQADPTPQALLEYAERSLDFAPSIPSVLALPESGYFRIGRGESQGIVDCGDVGPDELPAHAHADTLSFELSWSGRRVVVDSGTPEYALDDLRRYVRSTAAHNTVRVDDVEQSEVWGSHRVGRRARPAAARLAERGDHALFAGAHDGYRRLGVIHHRHIVAADRAWLVVDELRGRGRHRFESFLHLHPDLRLEGQDGTWRAVGEPGDFRVRPFGDVTCETGRGWYCPAWGTALPAPVLAMRGEAEAPSTFGYLLAPSGTDVDLSVDSDPEGITVRGRIEGASFQARSDRCTFSS